MSKPTIYKSPLGYNYSRIEKEKFLERDSSFSLKEFLKESLFKIFLILMVFLNLVVFIGVGYKGYILIKYKIESKNLEKENRLLHEEYKKLTSYNVILEKAKNLGLRAPQQEDYLKLEK